MVEHLASLAVPDSPPDHVKLLPNGQPNNESKANLDKKERLLVFANEQKADFIKLLVLLQWSKNVDEVSKTISINYWLMLRRQAYWNVIGSMAQLKRESPAFQIPNPDLKTAAEVLSRGRVSYFPRLGYDRQKDLSNKQILRVLKSLNQALTVQLALSDDPPPQLRMFRVHDGRATFSVRDEFELDVSTLDESLASPVRMVDFRFCFQPSPHIPERLRSEIEHLSNSNIDQGGLRRCYEFLHELALSYKLAEFHKQALELSRNQWARNLHVEQIRRNLVVQYWSERQAGKSWVEFGIASGRRKHTTTEVDSSSFLEVKCSWQGSRVDSLQLHLNESVLSFEDVLRQVIAQHTTQLFDSIYDRLVLTPLYANGELSVEQSLSYEEPEECSLVVQISRSSHVQLKVDPVTGLVVLSPVSERTERLQFEINRVQGISDEVVSKLLNFRCSVVEGVVLTGISGTKWEALRSCKFSQAEVKSIFGRPIVRMNMFRQSQWAFDYALAVTHSQDGDYWWLLQQIPVIASNAQTRYKVLRSQRIEVTEDLSSAYFARLADYSMGLICLQRNADFFREANQKFDLRSFPDFQRQYELPQLLFDLDLAKPAFSRPSLRGGGSDHQVAAQTATDSPTSLQKDVKVSFGGMDQSGDKAVMIAQYEIRAKSAVLRRLNSSVLGADVTLNPRNRIVTIRVETPIADVAIPEVVSKAVDLERVVSTVDQIHCLPGLKLKTVSNSRISLIYHEAPPTELGLDIIFASGSPAPRLDFLPHGANPHQILSAAYVKLFTADDKPFGATMRNLITNLDLTLPLLTYLRKLEQHPGLSNSVGQQAFAAESEHPLRVHVLVRSETHFGIQYFTAARQAPKEVKNDSLPNMLARFEIYNHVHTSNRPVWTLRAALEEFQSYSRPSFSAPELLTKVKQEIFFHRPDVKVRWITLDSGAACDTDQPEPLLQTLHEVLLNWVKQAASSGLKAATSQDPNKIKGSQEMPNPNKFNQPNGTSTKGPGVKGLAGRPQAPTTAVPNGANKMQRPPAHAPGARTMPNNAKTNAKNSQKEVITLD